MLTNQTGLISTKENITFDIIDAYEKEESAKNIYLWCNTAYMRRMRKDFEKIN